MMRLILTALAGVLALPAILLAALSQPLNAAECTGRNLIDALTSAQQAELRAAVEEVPYHRGLFWQAERDGMRIILLGTYHFSDPRHDLTLAEFGTLIDRADRLLVEAGPDEMRRLGEAMQSNPELLTDPTGPTLPERLEPQEWQVVSAALAERGLPPVIASRMRPWYVSMMMGLSPCMLKQMASGQGGQGLDQMLIDRAHAADVGISALEPWDTVFAIFADLTPDEEIDMIRSSLPAAEHADDYGQTLADAYFSQEAWQLWEFNRIDAYANSSLSHSQIDAQFALAEEKLMTNRNRNWIAPLTDAARDAAGRGGHVVAGFGALHLPGENGILKLLEDAGWTLTGLPAPHFAPRGGDGPAPASPSAGHDGHAGDG